MLDIAFSCHISIHFAPISSLRDFSLGKQEEFDRKFTINLRKSRKSHYPKIWHLYNSHVSAKRDILSSVTKSISTLNLQLSVKPVEWKR